MIFPAAFCTIDKILTGARNKAAMTAKRLNSIGIYTGRRGMSIAGYKITERGGRAPS
jgi:hypothetical protein